MRNFPLERRVLHLTLAIIVLTVSLPTLASSQAVITTSNVFEPFAQLIHVPCANGGAGEFVLVSGTYHIRFHTTVNDHHSILKTHFQSQGVTGVGQITGDVYRATDVRILSNTIPLDTGGRTVTIVSRLNLVGGSDHNLLVHQNVHLTVNANGDITSTVDNVSNECN